MERHERGERIQVDGYVCPKCSGKGAFCSGCYGVGIVSEERLSQIQDEWNAEILRARQEN